MTQSDSKTPRADQFQGDREAFQGASGNTMKAIVYTHYGSPDVLQLTEVAKPTPQDNEVLVHVHAASVNAADWHLMRGAPFLARFANGLQKPKNTKLGADVAGRVEAVGRNVTQFQVGDDVFGCIPLHELGSLAEYVCAHEDALALKPAKMTFEQAAAVPLAAFTALQGLRDKGQIQPGQKVLINGESGGVGNRSVSAYKRALSPTGMCAVAGFTTLPHLFQVLVLGSWVSRTGSKKIGLMETANPNKKDLLFIKELLEAGKVVPVIDRTYPLSEVPEAIRYLEEGHAKGKVVITMEQNNNTSL